MSTQRIIFSIILLCSLLLKWESSFAQQGTISFSKEITEPSTGNANDGKILLKVLGGNAPYTVYFTSTALPGKIYKQAELNLIGLPVGTYYFTVQDEKGSTANTSIELKGR